MRKNKGALLGSILMLFLLVIGGCTSQTQNVGEVKEDKQQQEVKADEAQPDLQVSARVEGRVQNAFDCKLQDFAGHEVTVSAAMRKCSECTAPQDYTGIPVHIILSEAIPEEGTTKLTVAASDGFSKNYVLEDVMNDDSLILVQDGDSLQLVAGDMDKYDASYWIQDILTFTVE